MSLDLQPKKITVSFSIEHPMTGFIQMRFNEDVCLRPQYQYPIHFMAEQITQFDLRDPGFTDGDSSLVRALVASLVKDGRTGVEEVEVFTSRVVKVFYDPEVYKPHLFKADLATILRDVDRHGWTVTLVW